MNELNLPIIIGVLTGLMAGSYIALIFIAGYLRDIRNLLRSRP